MPDRDEIYKFLKENSLTTKDEAAFFQEYSNPQKANILYNFFKENSLTTKDSAAFYDTYFKPTLSQADKNRAWNAGITPPSQFANATPPTGTISNQQVMQAQQRASNIPQQTIEQKQVADYGERFVRGQLDERIKKAIKNTAANFPQAKQPQKEKELQDAYAKGDLIIENDAVGNPLMKKPLGFFSSFKEASDRVYSQSLEDRYIRSISDEQLIGYLNHKQTNPHLFGYTNNRDIEYAPQGVGAFLGEQAELLGKGAIGAIAGATSGLTGGASFGTFLTTAYDMASSGYSQALQKNYYKLKEAGLSDQEALQKAKGAALTGEALALGQGAILSGNLAPLPKPTVSVKGVWDGVSKSLGHSVRTSPKVIGSTAALSVLNDINTNVIGGDVNLEEMGENAVEHAKQMATMHFGLWALTEPARIPSYIRPQIENIVASAPREQVKQVYESAEKQGVIPEGKTEEILTKLKEFDEAKKVINNLPIEEEQKAAIAGKILQRNKIAEENRTLKSYGNAFEGRVLENENEIGKIDTEIKNLYENKNPFAYEKDGLTGERVASAVEEEKISEEIKITTEETDVRVTAVDEPTGKPTIESSTKQENVGEVIQPQQEKDLSELFKIDDKDKFYHASEKKRKGRLVPSTARQFGEGIYFSTNKDLVADEFGDNITEVGLRIYKPLYTQGKEWVEVQKEAIRKADEAYSKKKNIPIDKETGYARYDSDNLGEIDEIPAKFISDAAKEKGYDAIVDKGSHTYENEIIVLDESKIIYSEDIKEVGVKGIAYHGDTGKVSKSGVATYLGSKELASAYGEESGNVKEYEYNLSKPFVVKSYADFERINKIITNYKKKNPDSKWHPDTTEYINEQLKKEGYDGLIIEPSSLESEKGYEEIGGTYGEPQIIVFDKKNIKEIPKPKQEQPKQNISEPINTKQDAIQKPTTTEKVLRNESEGAERNVGLRPMEQGNKPKVIAKEEKETVNTKDKDVPLSEKESVIGSEFTFKGKQYVVQNVESNGVHAKPKGEEKSPIKLIIPVDKFNEISGKNIEAPKRKIVTAEDKAQSEIISKAEKVKYKGGENGREYIDRYIADGYDKVISIKQGAVNKFYLDNEKTGLQLPISGDLRKYAELALKKQKSEPIKSETTKPISEIKEPTKEQTIKETVSEDIKSDSGIGAETKPTVLEGDVDLKGNKKEAWMYDKNSYDKIANEKVEQVKPDKTQYKVTVRNKKHISKSDKKKLGILSPSDAIQSEKFNYVLGDTPQEAIANAKELYNSDTHEIVGTPKKEVVKGGKVSVSKYGTEHPVIISDTFNGGHTNEIKNAIKEGKYQGAISEGRMTVNEAKTIIESAGLEVPKEITKQIETTPVSEPKTKGKYETKANEIADKIRKTELPSWLSSKDPNIKKQGIGADEIKEVLARAVVEMGKLLDGGVGFAKAAREAVKELVGIYGKESEDDIVKDFSKYYNEQVGVKKSISDIENTRERERGAYTHLMESNIDESVKQKFKDNGIKYQIAKNESAKKIGDEMIEAFGADEAVNLARKDTFAPSVNSAVYASAIDAAYRAETTAKSNIDKMIAAEKWANLYDEYAARLTASGQFGQYAYNFYKTSPIGFIQTAKNRLDARRDSFMKGDEKNVRSSYDDIFDSPEFKERFQKEVQEAVKKSKREVKAENKQKISDAFDKLKLNTNNAYATFVPPQIINGAIEAMKQAVILGYEVADVIAEGVKYINSRHKDTWNEAKFTQDFTPKVETLINENTGKKIGASAQEKILKKWDRKLSKLDAEKRKELLSKSLKEIVENGGLEYDKFKEMYADALGLPKLTPEMEVKLRGLGEKLNAVDKAKEAIDKDPTPENIAAFKKALNEGERASREVNDLLGEKGITLDRFLSIAKLNTLGVANLFVNPFFNINFMPVRFLESLVKTGLDYGLKYAGFERADGIYENTFYKQRGYIGGLGEGTVKAIKNIISGDQQFDFFTKTTRQNIQPIESVKDLVAHYKGEKRLTKAELANAFMEAMPTMGGTAAIISRGLQIGDLPFRFAAERGMAESIARQKGLKGTAKEAFLLNPDEVSAEKIKNAGERAVMAQENMLTNFLNTASNYFRSQVSESPVGKIALGASKVVGATTQPFLKIPLNSAMTAFELAVPEFAAAKGIYHAIRGQRDEALSAFSRAAVGYALGLAMKQISNAGLVTTTKDDKEKIGTSIYQGDIVGSQSLNYTGFKRWVRGGNPAFKDGDVSINLNLLGLPGSLMNVQGQIADAMPPKDLENMSYLSGLGERMHGGFVNGVKNNVFGNTSTLFQAIDGGSSYDLNKWVRSSSNVLANSLEPAWLSAISRTSDNLKVDYSAMNLKEQLSASIKERFWNTDKLPKQVTVWGEKRADVPEGKDPLLYYYFNIGKTKEVNTDDFGYNILALYNRTKEDEVIPSRPQKTIKGNKASYKMTPLEYEDFQIMVGKNRKQLTKALMRSSDYISANDDGKIKLLQDVYEDGFQIGKLEFEFKYFDKVNKAGIIPEETEKSDIKEEMQELKEAE